MKDLHISYSFAVKSLLALVLNGFVSTGAITVPVVIAIDHLRK